MDAGLRDLMETNCKSTFIITGDLNYHIERQKRVGAKPRDKEFLEFVENNHLIQMVDKTPRGKNILDLVITSVDHMIKDVDVGEHFFTSDHQIVRFKIFFEQRANKNEKSSGFNIFKANYEKVRDKIKGLKLNKQVELLRVERNTKSTLLHCLKPLRWMKDLWLKWG
ncbi:hypothetical protein HELRODRAFT_164202 [Helobdella robusta]|uniref:Endonuclease/exonuclease/phosphatase domain-containing protein n=1 Tax=Helobdella robusta TaxID=6412 RepID=T1EV33_HELRO|nr:hypothetical protein HELRODRAFT_164202 [Helobdella robusta]ESN94370.1 hypothetical protein HELRODRAFT_164202 [Helobdella robusta]